jgi:hypothetical protein
MSPNRVTANARSRGELLEAHAAQARNLDLRPFVAGKAANVAAWSSQGSQRRRLTKSMAFRLGVIWPQVWVRARSAQNINETSPTSGRPFRQWRQAAPGDVSDIMMFKTSAEPEPLSRPTSGAEGKGADNADKEEAWQRR